MININALYKILTLIFLLYATKPLNAVLRRPFTSRNIIHQLHDRSIDRTGLRANPLQLSNPIELISKRLTKLYHAEKEDNLHLIAGLEANIEKYLKTYQAPVIAAMAKANRALASVTTIAESREILALTKPKDRLALCLAWRFKFPNADNLDEAINLNALIGEILLLGADNAMLDFANINMHDNHPAIIRFIIEAFLATNKASEVFIKNLNTCSEPLTIISSFPGTLYVSDNQEFSSLIINDSKLKTFYVNRNPKLTSLTINCPNLTKLVCCENPQLMSLTINCPKLASLEVCDLSALISLDVDCPKLIYLDATKNPRLRSLTLACPRLQQKNKEI
ncbi:hypothetical protein FJ365_04695 [Candidatus Dependentiae bacterium]|nr:hypothetical protein [Candidatus Dependentiae bacterium]